IGVHRDSESLGRADVQADPHGPAHPSHPAARSTSATAVRIGREYPWVHSRGAGRSYGPGHPHSTTTTGRPTSPRRVTSVATPGCRWASRTCSTTGPVPGTASASGVIVTSDGRPHGPAPTAIDALVATWTTVAPVRSGSGRSTWSARRAPAS